MSKEHLDTIWNAALTRLQHEMTKATFDTWLRPTHVLGAQEQTLQIGVRNAIACDWLEHRLRPVIERTLKELGHPLTVEFLVAASPTEQSTPTPPPPAQPRAPTPPPPSPAATVELVEFDPSRRGWIPVPIYAWWFWQPYLGDGPFRLWGTIRSFAQAGGAWPSVQTLADIVANGNKQKLIGRKLGKAKGPVDEFAQLVEERAAANSARERRDEWRMGWLEILEEERIVWSKRENNRYYFRVLDSLPLLTPAQVETLSERRQRAHEQFLLQSKIDFEEWQQLTLPSLIRELRSAS